MLTEKQNNMSGNYKNNSKSNSQTAKRITPDNRERIKLNLIFDYPVKWSKYKVLRDFIQNFYDSVGSNLWNNSFKYDYKDNVLKMTTESVSFNYEWLLHIGASTKRDGSNKYAGFFGEGFKIAALCGYRDFNWIIEMSSADWTIKVCYDLVEIDKKNIKSLAYDLTSLRKNENKTMLTIKNFSMDDFEIFESALLSFYYPENPLFGQLIYENDTVAIYKRSNTTKPLYFPSTFNYDGEGIIYASYQAMGSFMYPLIICKHNHKGYDRERNDFYKMDVIGIIKDIAKAIPPAPAAALLELLKGQWYSYPKKKYDFECWYPIVKKLIQRISENEEEVSKWKTKYPDLLIAEQIPQTNIPLRNRRSQSLSWLSATSAKYRLVQDGFLQLGYSTLENICEENGGFPQIKEPHEKEKKYIDELVNLSSLLFKDYMMFNEIPYCYVINNENSTWKAMANCVKMKQAIINPYGIKIRYNLPYIAIKKSLLEKERFSEAFGCFIHELSHIFGGDSSPNFSRAMTDLMGIVLENIEIIDETKTKWYLI